MGGEIGESAAEKSESEIVEEKIAAKIISDFYFGEEKRKISLFGESLSNLREYDESWEQFINGN